MVKKAKGTEYYILSCFVLILYSVLSVVEQGPVKEMVGKSRYNLVSYFLMLFLICLFAIALFVVFRRNSKSIEDPRGKIVPEIGLICIGIALFLCFIVFLYVLYCKENEIFPGGYASNFIRNKVNKPVYAGFICALFILFVSFAVKCTVDSGNNKSIRLALGLFFALICALCTFAPNPFSDQGGRIYHIHAYDNTIIHVANLKPFDEYNISIYGHYGLLYLPFLKILGKNYTAIAITISFFTFICFACTFYVCEKWIKNDFIYVISDLAICAIITVLYQDGQYYQVVPHRLLFPSITLYFISRFIEKKRKKTTIFIVEAIVGTLAIVWNLETGIVSIGVFCMFNLLIGIYNQKSKRNVLFTFVQDALLVFGCMLGSYLIVNTYSLLTGAERWMSISRFIFPMDSQSYKVGYLRTPFCTVFSVYVVQLVVFSCVILNYLGSLKSACPEYKETRIFLLCAAISGFGAATYFANRASWGNISISWNQMILVMGVFAGEGLEEFKRIIRKKERIQPGRIAGKMAMLLYVFVFAVEGCLGIDETIRNRADTNWDTKSFAEAKAFCEEELPEDCVAIGGYVPELMFQMHKDNFPVLADWSDMNDSSLHKARNTLEEAAGQGKPVLLCPVEDFYDTLSAKGYRQSKELKIGPVQFLLMEQKSE